MDFKQHFIKILRYLIQKVKYYGNYKNIKREIWWFLSIKQTNLSASKYYYGDHRYRNFNEEKKYWYGWWNIQFLKVMRWIYPKKA